MSARGRRARGPLRWVRVRPGEDDADADPDPGSPMLMLTTKACRTPRDAGLPDAWPGAVAFAVRPDHGLTGSELRAIEADAVVVEVLEDPGSPGALLAEVARRLPWLMRPVQPLLFADAPTGEADLRAALARGRSRRRSIEAGWSGEGRLERLLLGEAVASHPLAAPTLSEAAGRGLADGDLVDLLAATLGAELEGSRPAAATDA